MGLDALLKNQLGPWPSWFLSRASRPMGLLLFFQVEEMTKIVEKSKDKETSNTKETPSKDVMKVATKDEAAPKEAPREDHGMSKAEDKSMYSTRSS